MDIPKTIKDDLLMVFNHLKDHSSMDKFTPLEIHRLLCTYYQYFDVIWPLINEKLPIQLVIAFDSSYTDSKRKLFRTPLMNDILEDTYKNDSLFGKRRFRL